MHLAARAPEAKDFDQFFHNVFYTDRFDLRLRADVRREWDVFLAHPPTRALLVEDVDGEKPRIVGCGMVVFVTDAFVRWARSGVQPWINTVAAARLPDGSCPLLTWDQVRVAADRGEGLNLLLTRWHRANALVSAEEGRAIEEYLHRAFQGLVRGYRLQEMIWEATGEPACRRALAGGARLRADYADYYGDHLPPARPYLVGLTRREALADDGSLVSRNFVYTPARLGFQERDKKLLRRALEGDTDETLTVRFNAALSTIKSWWREIHARVEEVSRVRPTSPPLPGNPRARGGSTLIRAVVSLPDGKSTRAWRKCFQPYSLARTSMNRRECGAKSGDAGC